MSVTRNGKIARLPHWIRTELNQRLQDGELGSQLVRWLNGHAPVQEVIKEQFGGRPVSEQNLSEWKAGGYQDWLRHEETRLLVTKLTEQSDALDDAADGMEISDRLGSVLAAELVGLATGLLEKETDPQQRWQRLREVLRELSQLRRDDHRAVRTLIKRDRWNRECEREDEEEEKRRDKEHRERLCAPFWARLELRSMAEMFGGGDAARNIAGFILEMQNNLRVGRLGRVGREAAVARPKPEPATLDQTESNPIKPNQT